MQPELGRVSTNCLHIPPESLPPSAVTNRLIGGYHLTRILSLRNGSKNQIPVVWRNFKFGKILFEELDRTRRTRELRNNYLVSPTKLVVLTFEDFINHKSLVKDNVISPDPGDIVEPKEAGK